MLGAPASLFLLSMQAAVMGDFTFVERRDPIDDSLQVASVLENEGARLTIGCDHSRSRTIFATLETDRFLAVAPSSLLEGMMPFTYRVDDNPAESAFARYGTTVAMIDGPQARALAMRLANGSRIYFRVLGASGDIDASFSAGEARPTMERLAQSCRDRRLQERLTRPASR